MKLWLDDVRKPPDDSWTWVKNNPSAKEKIEDNLCEINHMSLDHDLGADLLDMDFSKMSTEEIELLRGQSEDNGYELVKWMCETKNLPPNVQVITIHSWNPGGAERMIALLRDHECEACYVPYTLR